MNDDHKLIPGEKFKHNYRYQISSTIQFESRRAYIKNLRAVALFIEENITDEAFNEMAQKKKPLPQIDTYKILKLDQLEGTGKLHTYEISLIPNYGNEEIIIKTVNLLGITNGGETRESGFAGCDVPVILDIECTQSKRKELQKVLDKAATDSFNVCERCSACGLIVD